MNARPVLAAATLVCAAIALSPAAHAQADRPGGVILRGNQLNEDALIQALTPEPTVRTRSLRVRPSTESSDSRGQAGGVASVLITFATNSAEISPGSRSSLDIVGRALNSDRLAEYHFAIEGHADPRGDDAYNLALSQARAESVIDYLVRNYDVSRDRLQPIGKGETELANPAVPTAPENRRVTIKTQVQ